MDKFNRVVNNGSFGRKLAALLMAVLLMSTCLPFTVFADTTESPAQEPAETASEATAAPENSAPAPEEAPASQPADLPASEPADQASEATAGDAESLPINGEEAASYATPEDAAPSEKTEAPADTVTEAPAAEGTECPSEDVETAATDAAETPQKQTEVENAEVQTSEPALKPALTAGPMRMASQAKVRLNAYGSGEAVRELKKDAIVYVIPGEDEKAPCWEVRYLYKDTVAAGYVRKDAFEPAEDDYLASWNYLSRLQPDGITLWELKDWTVEYLNGQPLQPNLTVLGPVDVRVDADGMSPICATVTAGAAISTFEIVGDWVKVYYADGATGEQGNGYIYKDDVHGAFAGKAAQEAPASEVTEETEPETADEPAEETEPETVDEPAEATEPEATDEPVEPTEPETADEPAEETEPETTDEPVPAVEKKVTIFTSRRTTMAMGEIITLTSKLEGFEDAETILYQWECDKGDGFEPVEGANDASCSYQATTETLSWGWRLTVYFK